MNATIPRFVDEVLREWDFVAWFAYDGFVASGRGVVGLFEDEGGTKAMYVDRGYFDKIGDSRVISMLDDYDPEQEFLAHFDAPGGTKTVRIGTPEGGRHPKRVWIFEVLRRASDEPDQPPENLPA